MGSVPNCRKEIADRYPIRWFKCKLKPPKNLKEKYADIFSVGPSDIASTNLAEMTIDTKADAIPYAARPYKLALQHQEFLRREIQALLDMGIIVPSVSQYAAPCMVVPRKCKNSPVRAEVV